MPPSGRIGWLLILASLVFFKIASKLCARFLSVPPGVYRGYDDKYRVFRWRNLVVSFIHASITACCSLTCVILYGKEMLADMVLYVNWPVFAMCSFATGYFLYDTLDIIASRRTCEKWDVLLHHVAVLIISCYVVTFAHCVGYQSVGMLIEVNTIFLHRRQLFKLAGRGAGLNSPASDGGDDRGVRVNIYANLFTFIAFRLFPLAYLTYGLFYDGHRLPDWFRRFYAVCILLINVINAVLLYRLIRADVWPGFGGGTEENGAESSSSWGRDKNSNWEEMMTKNDRFSDDRDLRRINGLRLRDNVDHIMKHVVEKNVHS